MIFTAMPLLEAKLGAGRVLARPGEWQLYVLNSPASVLWELQATGLGIEEIASLVEQYFGLDGPSALAQVESLISQWHQAGLIETTLTLEPCCRSPDEAKRNPGLLASHPDFRSPSGSIRATSYFPANTSEPPPSPPFAKGGTILTSGEMPERKMCSAPVEPQVEPQAACYTLAVAGMSLRLTELMTQGLRSA